MKGSVVTTNARPDCETLTSFLGSVGVFASADVLRACIAELISHHPITLDCIRKVNEVLNADLFAEKSASIDVRDAESCRTLSNAPLRYALQELASGVPEEVSQRILGQLKSDLDNQKAHKSRTTTAWYASLTTATCLSLAAIGFIPREEDAQQPPPNPSGASMSGHLARALYDQLAPPKEPERKIAPVYVYDRKSRELLFETADLRTISHAQSKVASYEVTLEGGATRRLTSDEMITVTHEAVEWIEGPVQVHDRDTGELLYSGEIGALGFTLTKFDPCLSLYVSDTEKGSSRTNVIEGVVLDRVVVSNPHGKIDIAKSLRASVLD